MPYMDEERHDEWKKSINQILTAGSETPAKRTEVAAPSKLMGFGIKVVLTSASTLSSPK